jgi:adenine-specific DNA-methyltransferase
MIISFLVQIEEFKRKLFEKQKFVTDSYELVPVSEISETHYETILSNDEQLYQWSDSYNVDASTITPFDLHNAPYSRMLVDTSLFEQSLTTEHPDNLLVKGENYQALSLLRETYKESVKCICVDPPYNTGNANFAYKDKYQRPTWLSMLYDRLKLARTLLRDDGVVFVSIDHNEIERLKIILDDIYGEETHLGTFVWKRRINDPRTDTGISTDHEYVVVYGKTENAGILGEERDFEGYSNPDNDPRGDWLSRTLKNQKDKHERPRLHHTIEDPETGNEFTDTWRNEKESMQKLIEDDRIKWPDSEDGVPRRKIFKSEMDDRKPASSWIEDTASDVDPDEMADLYSREVLETMRNEEGTKALNNIFGYKSYDFPKPPTLIKQLILWTVEEDDIVLDFFAGSGTTAQAVMELNQQRDESIRYILVELLSQAYDVTEERIRRLAYASEWENGEPQIETETTLDEFNDDETQTPVAVQCLQLESYEQALDAVDFTDEQSTFAQHTDYLLNYMLDIETASSPTLLDADQLTRPTEYELNLDAQGNVTADVMTTFNYLLGLQNVVKQHTTIAGVDYTLYDGEIDGDQVRVVWRHDADEVDYNEEWNGLDTDDYDRLYINGDSALSNATPIKQPFERQMFNTSTGDD